MSKNSPSELRSQLDELLQRSGLSFDTLATSAEDVVVFGSRARGLGRVTSDWDVLVVGRVPYGKIEGMDIVGVDPADVSAPTWLESELATHVARYGVWLKGQGSWRSLVRISEATVGDKARRIQVQAAAFGKLLTIQSAARLRHHAKRLRRNLQRLALLSDGTAMPTNPELDMAWRGMVAADRHSLVKRIVAEFDLGPPAVWEAILRCDE